MPTITIRVTEAEKAKLAKEAGKARVTLSDLVRMNCGLDPAARLRRELKRLEALKGS
jgi:phenylpyruvate tautomerase PptA (4-oxalocrotonate tautomerase family)